MEFSHIFCCESVKLSSIFAVLLAFSTPLVAQPNYGLEIDTAAIDGILVSGAGDDGIHIEDCEYGVFVKRANSVGVLVQDVAHSGISVVRAASDGIDVTNSGDNGIAVDGGKIGVFIKNTLNTGMLIQDAQGGGLDINGTGGDGITVINAPGLAGKFYGDVDVTGTLSKGLGTFKIDHPVDPENKFLYHSFVESPDMMNIYNGVIDLDENGEAVVKLPAYFEALNRQFRYQLTPIGGFAPLYIKEEISDNRFAIAGGTGRMKVCWEVTGVRKDPLAELNRVEVEVEKSTPEKGFYLHPEAYRMPMERGLSWRKQAELEAKVQTVSPISDKEK